MKQFNRSLSEKELLEKLKYLYQSNSISNFTNMISEFKNSKFVEKVENGIITLKPKHVIAEICRIDFENRLGKKHKFTYNSALIKESDLKKIDIEKFTYNSYQKIKTQIEYRKPFVVGNVIPFYNCYNISKLLNISIGTVSNHIKNLNKYYCFKLIKRSNEYIDNQEIEFYKEQDGGFYNVVQYTNEYNEKIYYLYKLEGISIPNEEIFEFKNGAIIFEEKSKKVSYYTEPYTGRRTKVKDKNGKVMHKKIRNYNKGRFKTYSEGIIDAKCYEPNYKMKIKRKKLINNYYKSDIVFHKVKDPENKSISLDEVRIKADTLEKTYKILETEKVCKKLDPNKKKNELRDLKEKINRIRRYFVLRNEESYSSYTTTNNYEIFFLSFECSIKSYSLIINYLDHLLEKLKENIIEQNFETILEQVFFYFNPILNYETIFSKLQISTYKDLVSKMLFHPVNLFECLKSENDNIYNTEFHYSEEQLLINEILNLSEMYDIEYKKKEMKRIKPSEKQIEVSNRYKVVSGSTNFTIKENKRNYKKSYCNLLF